MPKGRSAPGNVSPAYVLSSGARPAFVPTKTLTRSAALLLGAAEVPAGGAGAAAPGRESAYTTLDGRAQRRNFGPRPLIDRVECVPQEFLGKLTFLIGPSAP